MATGTTPRNAYDNAKFEPGVIGADDFILDREIRDIIIPYLPYGFMDFIAARSGKDGIKREVSKSNFVHHYEEDQKYVVATLSAALTGGATAGAVATAVINGIGSGTDWLNPFFKNQIVRVGSKAAGFVMAQVTSITLDPTAGEHEIILKPLRAADQLNPATVGASGQEIRHFSHATADGGRSVDSMQNSLIRFTQNMQMYRKKVVQYGGERSNKAMVKVDGAPYLYLYHLGQLYEQLDVDLAMQTVFGVKADNINDENHPDGPGKVINTQEGMEQFILNKGGINYDYGTAFDYDDHVAIDKAIDERKGPNEYVVLSGIDLMHMNDDAFFTKVKDATSFGFFADDLEEGKKMAGTFNVKSVKVGGTTFHWKKEDVLSAPHLTYGTEYPEFAFFIPKGVYQTSGTAEEFDRGNRKSYDALCIRYRDNGKDGSRMMKVYDRGPEVTGVDQYEANLWAEMVIQFAGIRHFGRIFT